MSRRTEPARIAIVCSGHGYGHATRQLAVAAQLKARGAEPTVFSTMPPLLAARLVPGVSAAHLEADVGFVQADTTTEDVPATAARLEELCSEERITALSDRLAPFDLIVADVAAPVLEAARRVGLPAVAVGSFDWAWIYRHYEGLEHWEERFTAWQAPHPAISLWPGPGMFGFRSVATAGLVGLQDSPAPLPERSVLVSFGRWGLDRLAEILPEIEGVTWITDDDTARSRSDGMWLPDATYPSLVAGSAVVLTKPGYGIVAESLLAGTRLAWIPRGRFPETPSLEAVLEARGDPRIDVGDGGVAALRSGIDAAVRAAIDAPAPAGHERSDAARVAALVLDQLADGSSGKSA